MQKISRRKLAELIADKLISGTDKAELLSAVAAYLLISKQTKQTELLAADVALALAKRQHHLLTTVTTAHPLEHELRNNLQKYITSQTGIRQVELQEKVRPSILGGIIIQTPETIQDSSVKSQLIALQGAART